jgi:transcriptional regulatory protein RtcR
MATLADAGRITDQIASDETARLQRLWHVYAEPAVSDHGEIDLADYMNADYVDALDLFDAVQLKAVIGICRRSKNLSDAGRTLFAASRASKAKPNDADRLKKYLAKFGLTWDVVSAH